ncbi:MAG: phosphatidylinositol-3-phosphatase [Nocardioidaceae bacterium]|jgi:acid phosphatase|nr:phosphatidylinositol-3-phosphatase [Nocardioidaceae bacterium]
MRRVLSLLAALLVLLVVAGSATGSTRAEPSSPARATSATVTKLLVFVEENHSLAEMRSGMPKTFALAQKYGYATSYDAITHPSLPNYLAITSGRTHGVTNDDPPSTWQLKGHTVFSRAISAGRTARVYLDAMPGRCALSSSGEYAVKHNAWAYFPADRSGCDSFDRPLTAFGKNVSSGRLPNAGMVVPDLCNDAHDCKLGVADDWFAQQMQKVFAGPDWASGHLAVVLTADEDDSKSGNRVLTVVIHPSQHGNVVSASLNHYSLFELYEDVLGLSHLRTQVQSPSMARAFGLPVS